LPRNAYAAQITNRKLTLGSSLGNTATTWAFTFDLPGTTALNGISFQICTAAALTCTTPTGWTNTGATLTSLTYNGSAQAGWTIDNASLPGGGAQYLGIKNNSSATSTANPVVVTFSSVTNPNTTNETFFARIVTYTGDDYTSPLDSGVVAASTTQAINLSGTMPESLVFCTGGSVSTTLGVPDCSTATSGSVSFNQLFSPIDTAYATSQMAASTNAGSGYVITVNGATLTSGSNTITAMNVAGGLVVGTAQFGMNVVHDTSTDTLVPALSPLSADVAPLYNGTNYNGDATAASGYDVDDTYKFTSGDNIASSTIGSDAQIFTSTYIANVPGSQPAGTYTTTLTYICTPTF
jgi:hypothetical protein